jgi:LmbE family N-acetylglucosaminyl deacetylase/glycosyltransferase involved in cell wall biosynthesis
MPSPESQAIPYESNDLRGERLLVLAPHPDDEVIGCGGLVALHLREHRPVRIVVVTDGAEAGDRQVREEESRKAVGAIGPAEIEFLRFADRQVDRQLSSLQDRILPIIEAFKPDLIAVPSPVEIHPDHLAVSRAFCDLVQKHEQLFADRAIARVAFYEVSAPIRPNTLVDISSVADAKYTAIDAHASQLALRPYRAYAEGLNAYRSMTLAPDVKFAEAYWVMPLRDMRTLPFSAIRDAVGAPAPIQTVSERVPISVIIRTKDRPALLTEAVDSVRRGGFPAEIVVVNDGGAPPSIDGVTIINQPRSTGRSEAMNTGVKAARSAFIAFLDDDDLFYAEHLASLSDATHATPAAAWYTDAVSAFVRGGEPATRMRIYAQDFDRETLLLDNYIPLISLLVRRDDFLDLGGFDPAFDLFEDWDFLIRLSRRGDFARVPRVTCEIRHIEGSGSITLESPEGSKRFREAKLQVWQKHAALIDNDVIANVLEKQKRLMSRITHDDVVIRGERDFLTTDIARLEREKGQLQQDVGSLHARSAHLDGANAELRNALAAADAERYEKGIRLKDVQAAFEDVSGALAEAQRTNGALRNEVARLQGLLDLIYQSRTWKLHSMVEKMKGRG